MLRSHRLVILGALLLPACPGGSSDGTGGTDGSTGSESGDTTSPTTTSPTSTSSPTTTVADSSDTGTTTDDPDTTGTTTDGPVECPYVPVDGMPDLALQTVATGFVKPVLALGHPTEPDRLFVVDQVGSIKILEPGSNTAPEDSFLEVDSEGFGDSFIGAETGLLGFAFHPDFPDDPRVYVAYSPNSQGAPPMRVSEFTLMDGDPNHADPLSERVVIEAAQPAGNHNGGMIVFGPDGYLYIGLGDGGNADDEPQQTGRNTGVILAKIIRISPEPDGSPDAPYGCGNAQCANLSDEDFDYTIPADNPFVGDDAFAPEVWAWGVRNPWRFSFDSVTGDMYMGDVGQNQYEEIAIVEPGSDHGWSSMEGFHCFGGASCEVVETPNAVNGEGMTMPISEYSHQGGRCSVTGGAVYHSCEVPAWDGLYVYGDFCSREMFALAWDGSAVQDFGAVLNTGNLILGSGWNAYGDVFLTAVDGVYGGPSQDGIVYRLAPG